MRRTSDTFVRLGVGVVAALTLAGCGGSDGDSSNVADDSEQSNDEPAGDEPGDNEPAGDESSDASLAPVSGTIESLIGDGSTGFTIMLPEGFAQTEPASATSARFEDPEAEFGDSYTRVELTYLPEPSTAQQLIASWMAVNSTVTVVDQADETGLSWFTYTTPSSTDATKVSFGTASTSLTLADGTALECRALTQVGIENDWSDADAESAAATNLGICRTMTAG